MSTLETAQPTPAVAQPPAFAARIGLDWADQKHFWTMLDDGDKTRGQLDNTPEAIEVWAAELAQRFGGRPVALALEQSRGAVIAVLSKYAHLVLFPIHPTSLANYRKSFSPPEPRAIPSMETSSWIIWSNIPRNCDACDPTRWKPAACNFSPRRDANWWMRILPHCKALFIGSNR